MAETQADLYGHLFKKEKKRVQIRDYQIGKIFTYVTAVDEKRIREAYDGFQRVDSSNEAVPPLAWKCKMCEFRSTCPVSRT